MQDSTVLILVAIITLGFITCFVVVAAIIGKVLHHIKDLEFQLKSVSVTDYEVMKDIEAQNTVNIKQLLKKSQDESLSSEDESTTDYVDFNKAVATGLIPDKVNL